MNITLSPHNCIHLFFTLYSNFTEKSILSTNFAIVHPTNCCLGMQRAAHSDILYRRGDPCGRPNPNITQTHRATARVAPTIQLPNSGGRGRPPLHIFVGDAALGVPRGYVKQQFVDLLFLDFTEQEEETEEVGDSHKTVENIGECEYGFKSEDSSES